MKHDKDKTQKGIFQVLDKLEERHPYRFSFVIAVVFSAYIVFFTPSFTNFIEESDLVESLDVINLEEIRTQKRSVRRTIDNNLSNNENADVDRAQGTSDESDAVDLAFYPDIVHPKLIRSLPRGLPKLAREHNVEAIVNTDMLISKEGKVIKVTIKGVLLLKQLPEKLQKDIELAFKRTALKRLMKARFTPTIYKGKPIPLIMNRKLRFRLEN